MKSWLRLTWHFGWLILMLYSAYQISGLPGALLICGAWACFGTLFDVLIDTIKTARPFTERN